MKKLTILMTVVMAIALLGGCAMTPVSKGNFQALDERVMTLEGIVGGNITRIDDVESRVSSYDKAIAKLRAKISGCAKRAGQVEDRIGYTNPKVYAFWARGFSSGSSTVPEKMKAQLDVLSETVKKENISIKKIVGYSDTAGNAKANSALSMRRAEAVKIYLVIAKSLNLANVKIISGGETARYGNNRDNRCVAIIGERGAKP